jgi:dTDP-4-dehydrorhamnose reductase
VHVSTDAVFDGERGGYRESDPPRPVNDYGRTKLEGEQAVLTRDPGAAILRTNFFGWHALGRRGLAEWFLSQFESSEPVPGFLDSWIAPLLVNDLAGLILEIAALGLSGVYHAVGTECLSKYEFGRRLAVEFGFDEARVRPVPIDEAGLDAPRPRNLCLDNSKLKRDAGLHLPGASEGLVRFRQLKESGYVRELKSLAASVEGPRQGVTPAAGDREGQPWPG